MKKKSKYFELVFRSFEETKTASGGGGGITPEGNVTLTENGGPYDVSAKAGAIVAVENEFKPLLSEGYKEFDIAPVSFSTFYSTSVSKTMAITSSDIVSQLQVGDKVLLNGTVVYNEQTTILYCCWGTISSIENGQAQYTIAGMSQRRYGAYRRSLTANGEYNINGIDGVIINVPPYGEGSVSISSNGEHDVSGKATAVVNVPNPSTGSISITENGTYDVSSKASAVVNVPNPSTGSLSITENGTYDVSSKASAVVNVSGGGGVDEKWRNVQNEAVANGSIEFVNADFGSGFNSLMSYAFSNNTKISGFTHSTITSLPDQTFAYCSYLSKVIVPAVTTIGQNCLTQLGSQIAAGVSASNCDFGSLKNIGNYGFYKANLVGDWTFTKVETIGSRGFAETVYQSNKPMLHFDFPVCTTLGQYCFYGNARLETLKIPSVTSIPANSLNNCTKLKWIQIGGTSDRIVTVVSSAGLNTCSALTAIYVPDALVNDYKTASNWSSYANKIKGYSDMPS